MSYITYLGSSKSLDFEILKENEFKFTLENNGSDGNIKEIIRLPYIYECMTMEENPIFFNWDTESLLHNKKFFKESVTSFLDLCEYLKLYLKPDEIAILYTHWIDDPSGDILKIEINLNYFEIKEISISHKTLLILRSE